MKDKNECHRSKTAYPRLLRFWKDQTTEHVACSGAIIGDLLTESQWDNQPPQISSLDEETDIVSLTIGGNDLGFPRILTDCVISVQSCTRLNNEIVYLLIGLQEALPNVYSEVREAAPAAEIFVLNYPSIFPKPSEVNLKKCDDVHAAKLPDLDISPKEISWITAKLKRLNDVIRGSTIEAGVHLVDVEGALRGHEVCTNRPWVRGVTETHKEYSFHPLERGHEAMSDRLLSVFRDVLSDQQRAESCKSCAYAYAASVSGFAGSGYIETRRRVDQE